MDIMRGFVAVHALVFVFVLLACGRDPKIQLKAELPTTPSNPFPKPGDGIDPSGGETPVSQIGYRVFCESTEGKDSILASGRLGASSGIPRVLISVFDTGNLIVSIQNLVPVERFKHYQGRFLFEGQALIRDQEKAERRIYLARIDVSQREGSAAVVSKASPFEPKATELAERLRLNLRNFGASTQGSWFIAPYGTKLGLFHADDLSLAGVLELPSSQIFFPSLDEESGLLSYMRFKNGRFVNELVRLSFGTSEPSVKVVQVIEVPEPPANWTAIPMEFDKNENAYIWTERPLAKPESAVAMVVNRLGEKTRRYVYSLSAQSMRLGLQTAFQKPERGEMALVVAVEPSASAAAGGRLALLVPSSGAFKVAKEWSYPKKGLAFSSLTSSQDHMKWVAGLQDSSGKHVLFRADELLVQNGAGDCRSPVLIAEEY